MAEHRRPWTPGPWMMDSVDTPFCIRDGVCQGGDDSGDRVVFAEDGEPLLATLPKLDGAWFGGRLGMEREAIHVQQANARLIAAAPDQHEALDNAPRMQDFDTVEEFLEAYEHWFTGQRQEALAKALGAQP